ncbi:DUF6886 family protein [Lederbergia lenta]|uniref:DUF6886 family protein n=1 Tax=Lederbergia lenta TaxID=1467 RepID=UPI00350E355C
MLARTQVSQYLNLDHQKHFQNFPRLYAIDKEHSAHYYFPRDCPREKQNGRMRKMKIDSFPFQM